jgi:hypothetical protein
VVSGILPSNLAYKYNKLEPYGFFIIIILLSSGFLWGILGPIVNFLITALGGRSLYM